VWHWLAAGLVCAAVALAAVYKPDLLYWEGDFRDDTALAVGADGRIAKFLPASQVGSATPLRGRALLPGLVNGHSHAFQRLLRGRTEFIAAGRSGDDFWSWRERMYQAATTLSPDEIYIASRHAFLEMALAGITSVGEFHYLHHSPDGGPYANRGELALQVIRAARDVGLRIALLRVAYARAGFEVPANPRQRRFIDADVADVLSAVSALAQEMRPDPCVSVSVAPHSVRAVPKAWLAALAQHTGVIHMHVAEQPKEVSACVAEHGRRPVELLGELGLLRVGFTAVHAIHLEPNEVTLLGQAQANVCACPSTERDLGDGVVPADALLRAGVHVCLGSDSQVTVDVLDEARQLEGHLRLVRQRRGVLDPGGGEASGLARRLFETATREGARSLGLKAGELRVGAPADFFTVELHHPLLAGAERDALLSALVFGADPRVIRDVAVAGKLIVKDGIHPLAEASAREFSTLSRRVFA
jgi:formimidoylglutamate deiminase